MPELVAWGGREQAFDLYKSLLKDGNPVMLLVDSETSVSDDCCEGELEDWEPWKHLKSQAGWEKPMGASNDRCHLMVQIMEAWFIADRDTLIAYFSNCINKKALPAQEKPVESIAKLEALESLKKATKNCKTKSGKNNAYNKGSHSFKILEKLDPEIVQSASPWAKRFIVCLKTIMNS